MSIKKIAALLAAGMVAGVLAAPTASAATKLTLLGKDPVSDWSSETAPPEADLAAIGDALGQDLTSASIGMKNKKTVEFVLGLNSLPPIGGAPEFSRYSWNFTVDGKPRELDGKFTNYSRGVCDPTSGQCPPPRDPGSTPFFIRGECGTTETPAISFTACEELAVVEGIFDTEKATITVPVPLKLLGGKPGSKIAPASGTFSATITAAPSAFLTSAAMPMDKMTYTKTYVVPKGKKAKKAKKKKR